MADETLQLPGGTVDIEVADPRTQQLGETGEGAFELLTPEEREFAATLLEQIDDARSIQVLVERGVLPAFIYALLKDAFDELDTELTALYGTLGTTIPEALREAISKTVKDKIAAFIIQNARIMAFILFIGKNIDLVRQIVKEHDTALDESAATIEEVAEKIRVQTGLRLASRDILRRLAEIMTRRIYEYLRDEGLDVKWDSSRGYDKLRVESGQGSRAEELANAKLKELGVQGTLGNGLIGTFNAYGVRLSSD